MSDQMNMADMFGKMMDMQKKMSETQETLASKSATAEAGGGMVKVTANGQQRITSISIEKEVVDPEDIELLEDLIMAGINKALDEVALILGRVPLLELEASGHTDSKGTDSYNQMLAKKRSASVVSYLTSKGIDGKRIRSISKGESTPVAINTKPDGSDSPDGRKLNRRVEFRVVNQDLINVKIEEIIVPENLKK